MTSTSKLCVIAASLALVALTPLSAAPKKGGGPKLVPFKGKWTGIVTVTTTEDTTEPTMEGEVPVTTTTTEISAEGIGNGTHLGRFTMESLSTSSTSSDDPTAEEVSVGAQVFTAANGDQVFATVTGEAVQDDDGLVDAEYDATITGGTGRFENSTGYFTFRVTFDPETGKAKATYTGKISGPGKGN
jgi:hypothetical protein